mmetsp:Transcript_8799/g.12803  ORF Transcript_8799/g.12803 Transcript_8799/m.12803 type:complete len:342 (+) Transcript_8799:694-1719(+)
MVTKETVRSRLKPQRKLMVANTGVVSPMVRMEGYFVDIFLTLGAMRQPSNATEGLQIINSMIKGTVIETDIYKKGQLGLPMRVERHDIVGIVHRAWLKSFANIETNKQAVADRGWNPLTRNLLDHPELKNTKNRSAIQEAYSQCLLTGVLPMEKENINLEEGASKTFFDKIVDNELRQRARNKALTDRKEEIRLRAVDTYNNATKITAGVVFKGHGCILDQDVTKRVQEVHKMRQEKEEARAAKRIRLEDDMKKKVEKTRSKAEEKWSTEDYKVMVSWYKRPGDSKMPTTKAKLKARYELTSTRREDERNRLKPGEQPAIDDDFAADDESVAAAAAAATAV